MDDVKINSKLTVGEDVADLGGLMLHTWPGSKKPQATSPSPSDELTPEQRSFVGYAQGWWGNERPEGGAIHERTAMSGMKIVITGVVSIAIQFGLAIAGSVVLAVLAVFSGGGMSSGQPGIGWKRAGFMA